MLQGRLFAYHDAALYRVGTNHQHLPVNRPRCPFHNQQRDGAMAGAAGDDNGGAAQNYAAVQTPRSFAGGLGHGEPGLPLDGAAGRYDGRFGDDPYTQAGNLYRLMPAREKQNLVDNMAAAMQSVSLDTIQRQLGHLDKADPSYGAGVRASLARLGVSVDV
jgi:catalase